VSTGGSDEARPRDALHAKLRRLRNEGGERAAQAAPEARAARRRGGMPPWLAERLGRREGAHPPSPSAAERSAPPKAVGPPRGLVDESNARGRFALRRLPVPDAHRHGAWSLAEVDGQDPDELALLAKDAGVAALDLRRAVYLDIETTGLSGGAGTTPFLVGLGWFECAAEGHERFVLWQGFLRGPEEEAALLEAVAGHVRASSGVVSFFGKSFDRHRLEDKMRVHGVEPPFAARPHLDLYHPLRRLYREALPDGKLQTMERALCGVAREDDLPGSFAPAAWFDYLGARAHHLEHVFRHNADDVLSLVVLAAHLGRTLAERRLDGTSLSGCPRARARGLVRLFDGARRRAEALPWLARIEARPPGEDEPADERFERVARRVRRLGTPGWKKNVEFVPISWKSPTMFGRQRWNASILARDSGCVRSSQSRFRSNQ